MPLALNTVPFNWFDVVFVTALGFGLIHGRKNGMSKEVLPVLQWLSLVLVCGHGYPKLAQVFAGKWTLSRLEADVLAYLTLALAVFFLFAIIKRILLPHLTGSNFFGGSEYYLGMFSGMILFACRLLVLLALLNASYYTKAEIQAHNSYVKRWYGSSYFPDLQTVQEQVFVKSFLGPSIKEYLSDVLIDTTPPSANKQHANRSPTPGMPAASTNRPTPVVNIILAKPAPPPPTPAKPVAPAAPAAPAKPAAPSTHP